MSKTDLPYLAEYAKSGRAICRDCCSRIELDTLRLAVIVQSTNFDGKHPEWFHFECFFQKHRPKTVDDIEHYESLRVEDQDKIKERVELSSVTIVPDKKGKKRAQDKIDAKLKKEALEDFRIEYSKSGTAACGECDQEILENEVRISKKDYERDVGKKYGGQDLWHHVTCFAQVRADLGYFESGDKLPGFKGLKKEDQDTVIQAIVPIKQEDIPEVKKVKVEDEVDAPPKEEDEYRKQNKLMYTYRDALSQYKGREFKEITNALLEYNNQKYFKGKQTTLDHLMDIMAFGALVPCDTCKGQFVYSSTGYVCKSDLTDWAKCNKQVMEPRRKPFMIPDYLNLEHYSFLKDYKCKPTNRIIKVKVSTNGDKKEEDNEYAEPRVKRDLPPLHEMKFVILGHSDKSKEAITEEVTALGGKIVTKIDKTVMALITTEKEVEKLGSRMQEAESEGIHAVSEDFLKVAKYNSGKIPDLIIKKSICSWGTDPTVRLPQPASTSSNSKSQSIFTMFVPESVKLKSEGGTAVDPDSGLQNTTHVYQNGNDKYTAILGLTDIQSGKNSYYKLQLLEADGRDSYWVFRSWGRIGTTIGGKKLEEMDSLIDAKENFEKVYKEKSGNEWRNRHNFKKVPGRKYPIEMDYLEEEAQKLDIVECDSKLHPRVQDLIKVIFDVNTMKNLMLEFELDTKKMPLGKLSKAQIQKAFGVLSELQTLINEKAERSRFIDASNRFYTFIPHSFGVDNPPILDDPEVIKQKIEMLDSLLELEIAYNVMNTSGSEHTVDSYYKQLNTEIDVLDKASEEFQIIEEYVKNTHAADHNTYELVIDQVYTVKRQGEEERHEPFRKLPNRKLLWHGSRVTNFAGILSQGLRIAPPEAPVTGYMFGKGIYFADMVSKSANYCCTNVNSPLGLMLLCDVALGNMHERLQADYIKKLPKGKHSCKGVGMTHPDPSVVKKIGDIEVPVGKGVSSDAKSSLLYNEYIVYDVAQVNIKYLLKMHFEYRF
ncbi:poly [ADP-ribose] polymerase isoform X1 [Diabrotica virgifera virgifera]|uniref:Poly [ADP-ribose] polymerase n=1 Tax=Diabrotica virgifera virgifera TaxID=50390 RepID=A0ABM5IP31_DIAVI|nr:poly [ADP-ribose] polymerase isoform X1 [Diabrotica virgifera virgifera]